MLRQAQYSSPRSSDRLLTALILVGGILALLVLAPTIPMAQQKPVHLNPVIAKLAEGKTVYGVSGSDLSITYARQVARAPVDYFYVDMEHFPLDFNALETFRMAMQDMSLVMKKGNLQPDVAFFAKLPPSPLGSEWVVKQALDLGLHGVLFNDVSTPEEAAFAIKTMRYPKQKGDKYFEPAGLRGWAPQNATWTWGISPAEYERRADLWPLNPDGDLLAIMIIESAEGIANVDKIASLPGVGALYVAGGNDLHRSLGVPQPSPELEAAFQKVLTACKAHKVACEISPNTGADVAKRVKEGWNIIGSQVPAINAGRALLGEQR